MVGPGTGEPFLLASRNDGLADLGAEQVLAQREQFLRSRGATIESASTSTVDGRPAVLVHYRLPDGVGQVDDTEYDISLAPSKFGTLMLHPRVTIVLGERAPVLDSALLAQIASTIRVLP
jgi:hypothetical protein